MTDVYVGVYFGVKNLRLRRRGFGRAELPQSRLQHIVRNELAHVLPSLRRAPDIGKQAYHSREWPWASVVFAVLLVVQFQLPQSCGTVRVPFSCLILSTRFRLT